MSEAILQIKAVPWSRPELCEFHPSAPLIPETLKERGIQEFYCTSQKQALGHPLLASLFEISDVKEILVKPETILVKKSGNRPWKEVAPLVGQKIREIYQKGEMFLNALQILEESEKLKGQSQNKEASLETDLAQRIRKVIAEKVAGGLASHGGAVNLVGIEGTKALIQFSGGCQGCGQATVTVKEGIEKILLSEFPELTGIEDVTHHHEGTNPYYK